MRVDHSCWKFIGVVLGIALVSLLTSPVLGAITPTAPYETKALSNPNPVAFAWTSSIAYYNNKVIYSGADGKIYGFDLDTETSTVISDTSALATAFSSVTGMLVADDDYLYFHDNGNSAKIYRVLLTDQWPADYESFDTEISSAIFGFTQNPWTNAIWFASADFFGGGDNLYLYEVNKGFDGVTERGSFEKPNGGGNGPIIFKGPTTLLYGVSIFGGDGYFHLVDSTAGTLLSQHYLTFTGGLAAAGYGYNNVIFATSGAGKKIFEIQGDIKTEVATTDEDAQGIAFDGTSFFISEQKSSDFSGAIRFNSLQDPTAVRRVTPVSPYRAAALSNPNPVAFAWTSSIAYYNNKVIYSGADGKIYGFDLDTETSTVISDTSALATAFSSVTGMLVADDDYLYFHDNGNSAKIYRVLLTDQWPADYESFDTEISSAIFGFTQNPWTNAIWFASADFFGGGDNLYLYEVNKGFDGVTERGSFEKPNGGGNGPIIFKGPTTLLYGVSIFGGDGYFHLVDSTAGTLLSQHYLTFTGGLAAAGYGYNNVIFATSGAGKKIFEIQGDIKTEVATTDEDAQGIAFDGTSFFISEQKSSDFSGAIRFNALWQLRSSGIPSGQLVGDDVDLDGDGIPDNDPASVTKSVKTEGGTGTKEIGISTRQTDGSIDTTIFIESVESSDPNTIDDTTNRPDSLPFGLVSFRLNVNPGAAVAVTVYLSEAAPEGSKWYKYDSINGWQDYSDHAAFSDNRQSIVLALKDGGYGDGDRIVNGYIVEPGGVGSFAEPDTGGGGGGCFIGTIVTGSPFQNWNVSPLIYIVLILTASYPVARLFKIKR